MEVKKIYQDEQGHWHIDYEPDRLIGLRLRVYIGQILITLIVAEMFFTISMLVNLMMGEPILDIDKDFQQENIQQEQLFLPD